MPPPPQPLLAPYVPMGEGGWIQGSGQVHPQPVHCSSKNCRWCKTTTQELHPPERTLRASPSVCPSRSVRPSVHGNPCIPGAARAPRPLPCSLLTRRRAADSHCVFDHFLWGVLVFVSMLDAPIKPDYFGRLGVWCGRGLNSPVPCDGYCFLCTSDA